ncbi:MAG: preprotein translocase [Spongiibacter sp.]|uniref:tyrosine-type recombinase/integrase n=1 Tax=Spongiibacter sp. TaxID=2024860 RepID=UPI000C0ABD84|nr:integrase family protein [Spongiibacter sp.]MAK44406.1 preprotein translocase [Spongiibacter sp.]
MSRVLFTAKRIRDFSCPADKQQAFLWDASSRSVGLGLRATPKGAPAFIFQGRFNGKTIRITIGSPSSWSIPEAQEKAREFQRYIDEGRDPRLVKSEVTKADVAAREAEARGRCTFGEAWAHYMEERKPFWSENSYRDHRTMVQQPGLERKNRKGVQTVAGPLWALVPVRLSELSSSEIELLVKREAGRRATRTRLAVRLLRAFLNWAESQPMYAGVVDASIINAKRLSEVLGKPNAKRDSLEREQLAIWFEKVREVSNPVISAYLQCLILTGARREELASLKWTDIDFRWGRITIGDKVEGSRQVPLTPHVRMLFQSLPRRNEWVFSSEKSASGRITEPSIAHRRVCKAIGVEVTLHGLRRSFSNATEWLEIPAGVTAQIMGHKPTAIAEKHYKQRPIDLLRVHHTNIERWILKQAGIEFGDEQSSSSLRLVSV